VYFVPQSVALLRYVLLFKFIPLKKQRSAEQMFQHPLNKEVVVKAARGRADLIGAYDEVYAFLMKVVDDAIDALREPQLAVNGFSSFMTGLRKSPQYFIVDEKRTLADFPDILSRVSKTSHLTFYTWLIAILSELEPVMYPLLREQVVLRGVHHFYKGMVENEERLDEKTMKSLRREFKKPNYRAKGRWLPMFFNGMQSNVFEIWVIETLLGE
jgi:hypothetical protein